MARLWEIPGAARRRPIQIKAHSRFVGGYTVTVLGTRWSRTWGILPKGDRTASWTGGINWQVKGVPYGDTLTHRSLALCKWRYR